MTASVRRHDLWAHALVHRLRQFGVEDVGVAPGSRSTPLALAARARVPAAGLRVHWDERGLAFHQLGHALATGRPAAVITTSGSAVANLLPAVVEASQSGVPLILLTADRPPELQGVGANQTLPQDGLFGRFARTSTAFPPPEDAEPSALLGLVDKAMAAALGPHPGPVHLNLPFREPLEPEDGDVEWPHSDWVLADPSSIPEAEPPFPDLPDLPPRTLVVVGRIVQPAVRASLAAALRNLPVPVLADATSGLRSEAGVLSSYDLALTRGWPGDVSPEAVVTLGGPFVSKRLLQLLESAAPPVWVSVPEFPVIQDPTRQATHRLGPIQRGVVESLLSRIPGDEAWRDGWTDADRRAREVVEAWMGDGSPTQGEARLVAHLVRRLPEGTRLLAGNSLPVRHLDHVGGALPEGVEVFANRGASGIDGLVATTVGLAEGGRVTVGIIGDLAALHDLNSLALIPSAPGPVKLVVIHNGGGGIFRHLPIARRGGEGFETLFAAAHPWRFEFAAAMFGIPYRRVAAGEDFDLGAWLAHPHSGILEVAVPPDGSVRESRELAARLA